MKKLEKKLDNAREELEVLQNDLQQPETDVSLGKGILSDIVLLEQHSADLRRIDREIAKLEANMPPGKYTYSLVNTHLINLSVDKSVGWNRRIWHNFPNI